MRFIHALQPVSLLLTLLGVGGTALLARPFHPEIKYTRVLTPMVVSSEWDPLDQAILRNLPFVASNPALATALRAKPAQHTIAWPIWVDACEVTNRQYKLFLVQHPTARTHSLCAQNEPPDYRHGSLFYQDPRFSAESRPVTGVSFYDAFSYCKAVGGRLPQSEEWEAIAAGAIGRLYPWGNAPVAHLGEVNDQGVADNIECHLYPKTDTSEGVYDLGTSVAEWTMGRYPQGAPTQSGGSALTAGSDLYALNYLHRSSSPNALTPFLGFRCVYDAPMSSPPSMLNKAVGGERRRISPGIYAIGPRRAARLPQLLRSISPEELLRQSLILQQAQQQDPVNVEFSTTEVTRRAYWAFLRNPLVRLHLYANPLEPVEHSYLPQGWDAQLKDLDAPVVGVDYWDAYAFAAWSGARLPKADEWTYAATSGGRHFYPFGDAYQPGFTATMDNHVSFPVSVQAYSSDRTLDGILDMGGNVSEWTSTPEQVDQTGTFVTRVLIKGGNYALDGHVAGLAGFQASVPLDFRSASIGIRLVREGN